VSLGVRHGSVRSTSHSVLFVAGSHKWSDFFALWNRLALGNHGTPRAVGEAGKVVRMPGMSMTRLNTWLVGLSNSEDAQYESFKRCYANWRSLPSSFRCFVIPSESVYVYLFDPRMVRIHTKACSQISDLSFEGLFSSASVLVRKDVVPSICDCVVGAFEPAPRRTSRQPLVRAGMPRGKTVVASSYLADKRSKYREAGLVEFEPNSLEGATIKRRWFGSVRQNLCLAGLNKVSDTGQCDTRSATLTHLRKHRRYFDGLLGKPRPVPRRHGKVAVDAAVCGANELVTRFFFRIHLFVVSENEEEDHEFKRICTECRWKV